jgi:hypothetical protein
MTTFTWIIEWMQCKPTEGDNTDVVVTAGWRCNGDYASTVYGTCSFPAPEGSFTPYADLTQDMVLGWCWANGVNKDATEATVQSLIDNQINPPVVQLPLPWSSAPQTA